MHFLEGLSFTFFVQILFGRIIQKGGGEDERHWYYKNLKYQWLKDKEDIEGSIEVGRWSEFYIFIAFKIRIVSNLIKDLKHLFCVLIF